jgi:nucleoside 2-deoxyribosyltransferase
MTTIVELMIHLGFDVLNPWKVAEKEVDIEINRLDRVRNLTERVEGFHKLNMSIGKRNEDLINDCDIVVAVLDGTDVDSGTASEIGFSYAKGKRIIGYRGDFRLTGDNEGSVVNLQVQYWIEESGGRVVRSIDELMESLKLVSEQEPESQS